MACPLGLLSTELSNRSWAGSFRITTNNFWGICHCTEPLVCRKVPRSTRSTDPGSHGSEKYSFNLTGYLTIFSLELIDRAFSRFRHKNVVHLSRLKDGLNILELWHGVTYAFKDLSLSCTGQFLQYFLEKKQKHVNILVGEYDFLEVRCLGRPLP